MHADGVLQQVGDCVYAWLGPYMCGQVRVWVVVCQQVSIYTRVCFERIWRQNVWTIYA